MIVLSVVLLAGYYHLIWVILMNLLKQKVDFLVYILNEPYAFPFLGPHIALGHPSKYAHRSITVPNRLISVLPTSESAKEMHFISISNFILIHCVEGSLSKLKHRPLSLITELISQLESLLLQ